MRTPKQDRSRLTRQKALESAVECLARYGWQGSTMAVVAEHVGISRGALQHHFPTREDLMLAAIEYMFEQRLVKAFPADAKVPPGQTRESFLIERLLHYYSDDLFKAALHVWTAAASEPAFREKIVPMEARFSREVYRAAMKFLNADDSDERSRHLIRSMMDLSRGLGLADLITDDSARRAKIAKFWAEELSSIKTNPNDGPDA
ncbi:MAG: TetR family transcriptional regulator [Gordonia sp. (in: high G+C Gram-positive bacteria)]|nr:MAG: TetR family transcriptional regulator [Gordonia sp. (in: high G+C Gram-positive bacteria)]